MSNCLICHNLLITTNSWGALLSFTEPEPICGECSSKLEKIDGELCSLCGRPFNRLATEYRHNDMCHDCFRWQQDPRWKDILLKNHSVYVYNPFLKEIISLFKFRGDYAISQIFKRDLQIAFKKHFDKSSIIIPIPLSNERLYERGFNQAKVLAELLNCPLIEPLYRIHHEKQSKKSRIERIHTENIFTLQDSSQLINKQIILIDDIYTTGSTLRHAAEILVKTDALSVSSLTLARG